MSQSLRDELDFRSLVGEVTPLAKRNRADTGPRRQTPSEAQLAEQLSTENALWSGLLSLAMSMLALHGMAFGLGRMAANEAEKVTPGLTLVDVQMIGAAGRVYMSGKTADVERGLAEIERVLAGIEGRKP